MTWSRRVCCSSGHEGTLECVITPNMPGGGFNKKKRKEKNNVPFGRAYKRRWIPQIESNHSVEAERGPTMKEGRRRCVVSALSHLTRGA